MNQDVDNEYDFDDLDADEDDLDHVTFVCEDCDYRWEELSEPDTDHDMIVCPMCGSVNVTQL